MCAARIKTLTFKATTSKSKGKSSRLSLYTQYSDVEVPDRTPQTEFVKLDTGPLEEGKAFECSLKMPDNVYYFISMALIIQGDGLWLPKTMVLEVENTWKYVYPIVYHMNWPQEKCGTWSTDMDTGKPEIQILPLLLQM
ncbi:MAG: hypothetical protein F6K10_30135 [Moorea sp. SIO2B7]|nr:hypothetical protein [Moorena sp. SIO2B7]